MTFPEAIQLIAFQLVWNSQKKKFHELDGEYQLRRIFRWYSKAFSTPLHVVEELPLHDVIQSYWEEHYEGLNENELEQERSALTEDPDMLAVRQKKEDEDDFETHLMLREEARRRQEESKKNAVRKLEDAAAALKGLSGRSIHRDKEPELVMTEPIRREGREEVHISFVDDLDLDADPMTFGLLEPPPKRR